MFQDVLKVFNNVLRSLVSHAMIGIANRAAADRLRDRDNTAGIGENAAGIGDNAAGISHNSTEIGDNSAEIGDEAAVLVDIAANVIPCSTLS